MFKIKFSRTHTNEIRGFEELKNGCLVSASIECKITSNNILTNIFIIYESLYYY